MLTTAASFNSLPTILTDMNNLNSNRKRGRTKEEEVINEDMQVDEDCRAIIDLNDDELAIAQVIAQEHLKAALFIQIEIPSKLSILDPPVKIPSDIKWEPVTDCSVKKESAFGLSAKIISNQDQMPFSISNVNKQSTLLRTPNSLKTFHFSHKSSSKVENFESFYVERNKTAEMISNICSLILKQGNGSPSKLTYTLDMTSRSLEILENLKNEENTAMIGQEDTMDLFRILVFLLHKYGNVLPETVHAACQGILAINQITGVSRRVGGTSVKSPTSMVKKLLRNTLLLLPSDSRKLLNELIEFTCDFSQRATSRLRNVWAKQLSIVFGHALEEKDLASNVSTPSKKSMEASWKALFFELLIHSHGLHSEAYVIEEKKEIWTIDEDFNLELKKRYQIMKTPARKTKVGMTPRRSISRIGLVKSMSGASLKRNLFKSPFIETMNACPNIMTTTTNDVTRLCQDLFIAFASLNSVAVVNRNADRQIQEFLEMQDQAPEQLGVDYLFLDISTRYYIELQSFDNYMDQKEFVGAAASCRELKTLIDRISMLDVNHQMMPEEIYQLVEDQYLIRYSIIMHLTEALEREFFQLNNDEIIVKHRVLQIKNNRFHDTPIELDDFHSIIDVLSLQDTFNSRLIRFMFQSNYWNPSGSCLFEITKTLSSISLKKIQIAVPTDITEANAVAASLREMAYFISYSIFTSSHRPNDEFLGNWRTYIQQYYDILLGCSENVLKLLESCLVETDLVCDSINMTVFSSNPLTEQHLDYLAAVKEIIVSKDYNSTCVIEGTERGGFQKLLKGYIGEEFLLKEIIVTQKVVRFMDLIYSILQDLIPSGKDEPANQALIRSLRDCFDLFRLSNVTDNPKTCLRKSDCMYICHHISVISVYCDSFVPDGISSLLDMVRLFQEAFQ